MKTNIGFTASGDVNGMTVSYMQTSMHQFAGMSSARLSIDMGDMGVLAFDQGSGSGLQLSMIKHRQLQKKSGMV